MLNIETIQGYQMLLKMVRFFISKTEVTHLASDM
ncbi:hypothetical protein FHS30_000066 [Simiduia aestuariiviva]|uniref:Uncharacterized protein n=1 Tax=Simiduia aestuariiviva TaxID=1510459 RepID=A0A839UJU7_9GAMM|nr:hypothetical protein [Simiduia aestuariiviva]